MSRDGFLNIENKGTSMKRAEIQQRGKLFPTGVLEEAESDKDPAGHRFWREEQSQKGGQNKQCARTEKPRTWSVADQLRRGRQCSSSSSESDKAGPLFKGTKSQGKEHWIES